MYQHLIYVVLQVVKIIFTSYYTNLSPLDHIISLILKESFERKRERVQIEMKDIVDVHSLTNSLIECKNMFVWT